MNYTKIYDSLINAALYREYTKRPSEVHHILPRSMGGTNDSENLVRLTVREHFIAHLLLYKMGYNTQIFSVKAIIQDSLNPECAHRYKLPKIRYTKYIRRQISITNAQINIYRRKQR